MTFEHVIDHRRLEAPPGARGVAPEGAGLEREATQLTQLFSRLPHVPSAGRPGRAWLIGKRLLDIGLGAALAVAALPVIVVLALGVAASLRTWPFFVQRRVGRGGRSFPFPKLRTLPRTTPRYASKYEIPTDIGRLPAFLRRSHLDELPQLLLVPFGWMSLVGPRPEMPEDFIPSPRWFVEARTSVPQGCTGLWQVSPHTHLMLHEAPEYDLFYVRHASVRLDLWILWRTLRQFIRAAGPAQLGDVPVWVKNRSAKPLSADAVG